MAKNPRRPRGVRSPATPDPAASYAPPHMGAGRFGFGTFGGDTPEGKHAPEPVPPPSIGATPISYGEQPPPPDPGLVTRPVVVQDRLEVRATSSKGPVEMFSTSQSLPPDESHYVAPLSSTERAPIAVVPQSVQSATEQAVREARRPQPAAQNATEQALRNARAARILAASYDDAVVVLHVRGLIAAFEEVEAYNPERHHNSNPPALWSNDPAFRNDIKALLVELRRLNDFLESDTEPDSHTMSRVGTALVEGSGIIYKRLAKRSALVSD